MENFLRERFVDFVVRIFGAFKTTSERAVTTSVALGWHDVLSGLYVRRPGREYHNQDHVVDLLRRFDVFAAARKDDHFSWMTQVAWHEAELAIWFHDAIYAAGVKGCEDASARLAGAFLDTVGERSDVVRREGLVESIKATAHDGRATNGRTVELVLDLDLAGFADPWDVFEARNAQIRAEFSHVLDEPYAWGRLRFLSGLMSRRTIYSVLTDLEKPARANIQRHLNELVTSASAGVGCVCPFPRVACPRCTNDCRACAAARA